MRIRCFPGQPNRIALFGLCVVVFCLIAACKPASGVGSQPNVPVPPGPSEALITFTAATSYDAALQEVTDLGLQPTDNCYPEDRRWHPMGQQESFAGQHALLVAPTLLAPDQWLARVRTLPGYLSDQTNVVTSCPEIPYITPVPTYTPPDPPEAVIAFASTVSYSQALREVLNLGIRLADPCYEAALKAGAHPTWHPMGQETNFPSNQTLIVASTLLAPDHWLAQAQRLPGVSSVQTPVVTSCPAMQQQLLATSQQTR